MFSDIFHYLHSSSSHCMPNGKLTVWNDKTALSIRQRLFLVTFCQITAVNTRKNPASGNRRRISCVLSFTHKHNRAELSAICAYFALAYFWSCGLP